MENPESFHKVQEAEEHPEVETITYSAEKLQGRLWELAHEPVGGDILLSRAATGLARLFYEDDTLLQVFHNARIERSKHGQGLTSISGALLMLAHCPNKIFFDQGRYDYPQEFGLTVEDQEEGIRNYLNLFKNIQQNHLEQYSSDITNRNIQSTDFHRGLPLPSIIHRLNGQQGIVWADIGASAGFVSKRVGAKERFQKVDKYEAVDQTEYKGQKGVVMEGVDSDYKVEHLIGVDLVNPLAMDDADARAWFEACRMPSKVSLKEVEKTRERMALYSDDIPNYEFREGNMIDPPVEKETCNLVTAGTVLTHMDKDHRDIGISAMQALLKDDERSLLVLTDYLEKNDGPHGISTVKSRRPFAYGTWVSGPITNGEMWEVYQFENSQCRGIVRPGEDFIRFMDATQRFQ